MIMCKLETNLICLICLVIVWLKFVELKKRTLVPELNSDDTSLMPITSDHILVPNAEKESDCEALDEFRNLSSNFIYCSLTFARPVYLCQKCSQWIMKIREAYNRLLGAVGNSSCGEVVSNSGSMQIVQSTEVFIEQLWSDCKCAYCFENVTLSTETVIFYDLLDKTLNCFENFSEEQVLPVGVNDTRGPTVCTSCNEVYRNLSYFYDYHLVDTCSDVVDAMNQTRITWSLKFRCRTSKADVVHVTLIACSILVALVVFYACSVIFGSQIPHKMAHQKRLLGFSALITPSEYVT